MLRFSALSGICDISHFITTRHGGVSCGNYASMNPGEFSGDNPGFVQTNRKLLSEGVGMRPDRLFAPYQVHGAEIRAIDTCFLTLSPEQQQEYMHGVDALVTNVPGVCIAVSTADCVPVLIYSPDKKVVAAIHAGWRGTVQRIVEKAVCFMVDKYGCDPLFMMAGIAPSISKEAFEVGEEVVDEFRNAGIAVEQIMERNKTTGKAHIDLWKANQIQLLASGLPSEGVEVAGICTYLYLDEFFSARRLGIHSGRILSGIMINA